MVILKSVKELERKTFFNRKMSVNHIEGIIELEKTKQNIILPPSEPELIQTGIING